MYFEVIVDVWNFHPRKCYQATYKRGNKGYLPREYVLKAAEEGKVKILEDPLDGRP